MFEKVLHPYGKKIILIKSDAFISSDKIPAFEQDRVQIGAIVPDPKKSYDVLEIDNNFKDINAE